MEDKTAMSRLGRYVLEWASAQGLPDEGVWSALRTSPEVLEDPEGRISMLALYESLEHIATLTQNPRIGFVLPETWGLEIFDVLGFLVYVGLIRLTGLVWLPLCRENSLASLLTILTGKLMIRR